MPKPIKHAAFRDAVARLQLGDGIQFPLPERAYPRREFYRTIAGIAYAMLGAGGYRIMARKDHAVLWRPKPKEQS